MGKRHITSAERHARGGVVALLVVALVCVEPIVGANQEASDPEVEQLMGKLRGNSVSDDVVRALADKREVALPALKHGLKDPKSLVPCATVLSLMPPDLSGPVLTEFLEKFQAKDDREVYSKAFLFGALGRLKWSEAVPFLESEYKKEEDRVLRLSIAWALENTTGIEYGPSEDPWMMYK